MKKKRILKMYSFWKFKTHITSWLTMIPMLFNKSIKHFTLTLIPSFLISSSPMRLWPPVLWVHLNDGLKENKPFLYQLLSVELFKMYMYLYVICLSVPGIFVIASELDEGNHFKQVSLAKEFTFYMFWILALYQVNRLQVLSSNLWVSLLSWLFPQWYQCF